MLSIKRPLGVGFGISWKGRYWRVTYFILILLERTLCVLSWPVDSSNNVKIESFKCAEVTLKSVSLPSTEFTLDNNSEKDCVKNGSNNWMEIHSSIIDNFVDLLKSQFNDCGVRYGHFELNVNPGCTVKFCGSGGLVKDKCVRFEDKEILDRAIAVKRDVPNLEDYPNGICTCEEPMFDPKWTGVIYSAYDKYPEPCPDSEDFCHISWYNYTGEEIVQQLDLISTRFQQVSLYGMGTVNNQHKTNWKDGALNSTLTPLRIAERNRLAGYHRMKAVVGVFRQPDYDKGWVALEVKNAIDATIESNEVFPQTIWGISVQVDFAKESPLNFTEVIEYLNHIRKRTKARIDSQSSAVQVGVRIPDCERVILESNRSEDKSKLYCRPGDISCKSETLHPSMIELAKLSDFVICFIKPWSDLVTLSRNLTMRVVVQEVGDKFLGIKSAFEKVNASINFIGETGWPSYGRSSNESPNTLRNERNYWVGMSHWAKSHEFQIYMFEALDEPWKNNWKEMDKKSSNGVCGSEASYGFWKRVDNSSPGVYFEKFSNISGNVTQNGSEVLEAAEFSKYCVIDSLSKQSSPKLNVLLTIIGACLGISAVFFVIVFYMGYRLQSAKKSQAVLSQRYLEMFLQGLPADAIKGDGNLNYQVIALQFPYDKKKYELPKDRFEIDTSVTLGKGQSGTVYRGKIQGLSGDVAFKSTGISSSIMDIKNLLSEIKIMSYIGEHENVVCLLGAYTENLEKGIVSVALEFCSLGSLEKFFEKYRNHFRPVGTTMSMSNLISTNYSTMPSQPNGFPALNYVTTAIMNEPDFEPEMLTKKELEFDMNDLLRWSKELANGMEFLAIKKVVHADLACRNILLTENRTLKITDFGLSRKLYHELGETFDAEQPLPWRWMAPQSLRHLTFSTESDVWSYGVTLWELFSLGEVPYPGIAFCNQFVVNLENGFRMEAPRYSSQEIYKIILKCWKYHPGERPSFTQLKAAISNLEVKDLDYQFDCVSIIST